MRLCRRVVAASVVVLIAVLSFAADPPVPPAKATGSQWSLAMLPDSQGYNQTYDMGGAFKGRGFQYKDRWPRQIAWIVANRERFNIRFVSSVGDHVQNNGFDPAKADASTKSADAKRREEWMNVVAGVNLLHEDANPDKPALLPYSLSIGNHDYHTSNPKDAVSTEYEQYLGPGRMRDKEGKIKPGVASFYKGDDRGWEYKKEGAVMATGAGRNSWQTFAAGGRTFLHLNLECGVPDGAIAWAKEVIAANPAGPIIVTTHSFLNGAGANGVPTLRDRAGMGRIYDGANPSNDAQGVFDKLVKDEDRIFLILCGHTWSKSHLVMKNAKGNDVHVELMCMHLNEVGGRIEPAELPAESPYKGPADLDRNGSGWLGLMVFAPEAKKIGWFTYSPVIDVWATDCSPENKKRTFPMGDAVVEEFDFDFDARFGAVK